MQYSPLIQSCDRDWAGAGEREPDQAVFAKSITLSKVMSLEELEALEAKMKAAMEAERQGKTIEMRRAASGR